MWRVGISVSPCTDATKMGYDFRQINRIVIRLAQYYLNQNMCVVFGHDWREDGVMRTIAEYANKVAAGSRRLEKTYESRLLSMELEKNIDKLRMLNVVPTGRNSLSRAALDAQRESGGILKVLTVKEAIECLKIRNTEPANQHLSENVKEQRAKELTMLRLCITALLDPGCRICLGGKTSGYESSEPGVIEEARLALALNKPLFFIGWIWRGGAAFWRKQSIWEMVLGSKQRSFKQKKAGTI